MAPGYVPGAAFAPLAALGYRVHPCKGKDGWLTDWPNKATSDPETARQWGERWPDKNPGIATGRGLLGVDVDPHHGGIESLAILERDHGPLPRSRRVLTGRGDGGFHVHLLVPPGLKLSNSVSKLGQGLDIRTDGGNLMGPGSVHPETGGLYDWKPGYGPENPIEPAPWWLLQLLMPPAPEPRPATSAPRPEPGDRVPADILLERFLARASNGNRNDTGAELARQCRDNGYSQPETEDILRDYQARVDQSGEPYTLREALSSARSAFTRPPREPWSKREMPFPDAVDDGDCDLDDHLDEVADNDLNDCRDTVAQLRRENAALKRENARLKETNEFQAGVIVEQRRELEERRELQLGANTILAVPDKRHAVTNAKMAFIYQVGAAREQKLSHPNFPDHFLVYSAAAEAASGTTRTTVHTAKEELIAAGVVSQKEEWARDPETGEARRYLYYKLNAGADLAESMRAAAEAAQTALEDRPERKRAKPRPRCIHCGSELVCAACGCAQVQVEGDVQILNVAQSEDLPTRHAEEDLTAQILNAALEPAAPAPVNGNGHAHADPFAGLTVAQRGHCEAAHHGTVVPFHRTSWGTDQCSLCHPPAGPPPPKPSQPGVGVRA